MNSVQNNQFNNMGYKYVFKQILSIETVYLPNEKSIAAFDVNETKIIPQTSLKFHNPSNM